MKKIDKFLNKLTYKEREKIGRYLKLIKEGNFENLNLKKLTGFEHLYRVKTGDIRIIFFWENQNIEIIALDRRNDNTYNL